MPEQDRAQPKRKRVMNMIDKIILWFIGPAASRGRTDWELARIFVFTHIFGPLIAQPMSIYLYLASPEINAPFLIMSVMICSFWALPFILRKTGDMTLVAFFSFQLLAAASLFGAYNYGGFSSPFLPWLIVSLLLGLFYLARYVRLVLALFATSVMIFLAAVAIFGLPSYIPLEDLRMLGWLSIGSATVYMAWMALYYSRMMGLRSELELEAERSRATSRELERARAVALEVGQARSRFFSKMSHELRTPLNAIIGYSDILLEDWQSDPSASECRSKDIQRINAAGKHLLSLVSDVLDTDKIENEALDVKPTTFSLGALCDEAVANALPMVKKNGNRFVVICPRRDYELFTNSKKLRQMVLNLLSNAGKFTSDGTVKLELYIEIRPSDDQLRVVVTDTGIGIAPDALPRLFQDYEQADATVSKTYGGTGIGLALTRRLSILLGGEINVTSTSGRGSCFTITVPAQLHIRSETAETRGLPIAEDGDLACDAGRALSA